MTFAPMLLLLLVPGQDKPKADTPADRARRAAIVDQIMAEPNLPKARIVRPVDAAEAQAQMRVQMFNVQIQGQARKSRALTLEQPAPAAGEDEEEDGVDRPPPMPMRLDLNTAVLGRDNFDRWIFGDGFDEEGRRVRLQTVLAEKIDRAMKDQAINPGQLRKLRLAGGGDIKRFLDRVEVRRADFEVARKNFTTGRQALQQLEPLSAEFQVGPFGVDSLFAKMLRTIENESRGKSKER